MVNATTTTATGPPTLFQFQHAFLTAQIRILSQTSLRPSSAWRTANRDAESGLPGPAIEQALARANIVARRHARRVYTPQATRLVAERVEEGLLAIIEERGEDEAEERSGQRLLGVDADLSMYFVFAHQPVQWMHARDIYIYADELCIANEETVAALPETWPVALDRDGNPDDAARYAELVAHLTTLTQHRTRLRARVDRLRRVRTSLCPFTTDLQHGVGGSMNDDDATKQRRPMVQDNLLTRGSELERELERMKMLLARVGGRVALLPAKDGRETVETVDVSAQQRLDLVLDNF